MYDAGCLFLFAKQRLHGLAQFLRNIRVAYGIGFHIENITKACHRHRAFQVGPEELVEPPADAGTLAAPPGFGEEALLLVVSATYPLAPLLKPVGKMISEFPASHIRLMGDNMGGPLEALISGEAQIVISNLEGAPVDQIEAIT
jgi:hypothetical protein